MSDKKKTLEITKRLMEGLNGYNKDNFLRVEEFRLGAGYSGISEKRVDMLYISPNSGNRVIAFEVKVSRADFKKDINKKDKQDACRCFCNEFYYVTPKGLLTRDEVPIWAGLIEVDLTSYPYEGNNRGASYAKQAPVFDKCEPTWGMIVSALRRGERECLK